MPTQNALRNAPQLVATVNVATYTANATGTAVDLATYRFPSIKIVAGTMTDGTHSPVVQEADADGTGSPGTWSNVAANDLSGTLSNLTSTSDNTTQEVTYLGTKRFIRVNFTVTGATSGGTYGAFVELARPDSRPI